MGNTASKPFYKKWWFVVVMVIFAIGLIGKIVGGDKADVAASKTELSLEREKEVKGEISLKTFEQASIGMDKSDVDKIFGESGTLSTEHEMMGSSYKTYHYKKSEFEMAIITFKDGKVESKMQIGLK